MKSVNELQKQLNGLVYKIKECNYIPNHLKEDIIQDTWVKIVEKMEDGTLKDDFNEIKGYTFFILRNFCLAHHMSKDRIPTVELKWEQAEQKDESHTIYKERLKNIIRERIQATKYNKNTKLFVEYVLDGKDYDTIFKELGLPRENLRRIKQSLVLRLKADLRRPVKYLIKNNNDLTISIPCYSLTDIKDFFTEIPHRQITLLINNGFVTKDEYYVKTLIKRKNKII